MHYIPSGDCTGQHSSTTRRMYDYHAGNVYNRKCEHKYEDLAKICITLPMMEEKKNRHYNIQIYQWSYLLPKQNRGEKVIRLEKTSFLLFQISMLLTQLTFSYRMSLSYCCLRSSLPSSESLIISDIRLTTQSTSWLVPLFLLFFSLPHYIC